jgi:hypothetical protein
LEAGVRVLIAGPPVVNVMIPKYLIEAEPDVYPTGSDA